MIRVGFGYDVHRFAKGRKLILGGVEIPSEEGLLGHSDADALTHAIADALLGSLALGDIGKHFPDTDDRYAGVSSLLLLKQVGTMVADNLYRVNNVDSMVVLESPKLAPFVNQMRDNLADALSIDRLQVSVKATTNERLGFLGKLEGIAAYATVLVEQGK